MENKVIRDEAQKLIDWKVNCAWKLFRIGTNIVYGLSDNSKKLRGVALFETETGEFQVFD